MSINCGLYDKYRYYTTEFSDSYFVPDYITETYADFQVNLNQFWEIWSKEYLLSIEPQGEEPVNARKSAMQTPYIG